MTAPVAVGLQAGRGRRRHRGRGHRPDQLHRLPAHLAATGQAILASLPDDQVRAIYFGEQSLPTRTGTGPRTLAELEHTIAEVRRQGYAIERGSVSRGISCVAAGVRSMEGLPAAAVGLTWVDAAHTDQGVAEFTGAVCLAAEHLGRLIGTGASKAPPSNGANRPSLTRAGRASHR